MSTSLDYHKNDLNKSDYDPSDNDVFIPSNQSSRRQKIKSIFTNLYRLFFTETDETSHSSKELKNVLRKSVSSISKSVVIEKQGGLANRFVLLLLLMWYMCSALTLYTNKYIMATRKVDPTLIGTFQMIVATLCGYIQLRYKQRNAKGKGLIGEKSDSLDIDYKSTKFWGNMLIIGILRLFSIVLGLMALKQATISFVETIKSSSPLFTVIISKLLIGEHTGFYTKVSLVPIMIGLALCSSFELNFSLFGFLAAILTNFTECLQNVFSKVLLCSDKIKFTPLQVQFFTSLGSMPIMILLSYLSVEYNDQSHDLISLFLYVINGLSFNFQSLFAFTLMSYISPVTYSVCNTVKRAVLIWVSVILFQNSVSVMSAFGTFTVIFGVLSYNQAKLRDSEELPKNASKRRTLHQV